MVVVAKPETGEIPRWAVGQWVGGGGMVQCSLLERLLLPASTGLLVDLGHSSATDGHGFIN